MPALAIAAILQLAGNPACITPGVHPHLAAALVTQESGGDPLALHDDDAGAAVRPATADEAERVVMQRWALGRSVGVGLTQLTARSAAQFQAKFSITLREALDGCVNLRAGTRHWLRASAQIYNSGRVDGAPRYALSVENIAARIAGSGDAPTPDSAPTPKPTRKLVIYDRNAAVPFVPTRIASSK